MTDHVAEIDPFAPGVLDQETELAALTHALEFANGFSLLFVRCNQAPQRHRLMAEVSARLPQFTVQEIHFSEPVNHLLDALRERLDAPLPDAVFVSGLEHALPGLADAPVTPFIANLNASRNSFPQTVPRPLVLWAPEYVLAAIAQGAPDFFSVRSGVYAFAAAPEELAGFAHTLSAGKHWHAENLPLTEKRDRTAAIERLLAEYETLPVDRRDRRVEFRLLGRLGVLLNAQGNYAEALRQFQRALKLAEELSDRESIADSLHQLGTLHGQRGEYVEALQYFEQSMRMLEELDNRAGIASLLHNIGNLHFFRGGYGEALQCYERSMRIKEELGDRAGVANSLHQIGMLHQDRGEYGEAFQCYEQSMRIKEELGNHAGVANSLHQIGMLHQARGEYGEALQRYEQSLRIREGLGNRTGVARSLHQLGKLHQARGEYGEALQRYEQSLRVAEELGDPAGIALSLGQVGNLFTETGRYEEAFNLLVKSLATFRQLQSPNARIAANMLRTLRTEWGEQAFDATWHEGSGGDVPEWLQEASGVAS